MGSCHCFVIMTTKGLTMTRQNGVDLESFGKIENFQERSFREKKKKKYKISSYMQRETDDGK